MGIFGLFGPNVQKMKAAGDIAGLIKVVSDKGGTKSAAEAIDALVEIGDAAVEPLIGLLRHGRAEVVLHAVEALGRLRDARAVEPLAGVLERPQVVIQAITALGQIGDERAVEPLLVAMAGNPFQREKAVDEALHRINPRTPAPYVAALANPNTDVRVAAVKRLEAFGGEAVEPLITALRDTNGQVVAAVAQTLGNIGDARAAEPLVAILGDPRQTVRQAASRVLKKLEASSDPDVQLRYALLKGDLEGVAAAGEDAAARVIPYLEDPSPQVRKMAASALGGLGDARAVDPLVAVLKDPDRDVARVSAEALDRLGVPDDPVARAWHTVSGELRSFDDLGEEAVEPLVVALREPGKDSRAAAALGRIGEPALEPVIAALEDGVVKAADALVLMLKNLATPERAFEALEAASHSRRKDVSRAANIALSMSQARRPTKPAPQEPAAQKRPRLTGVEPEDRLVRSLMDTDPISRGMAIDEVLRRASMMPRPMLAAVEEALARLAGQEDIVFYQAPFMFRSTPDEVQAAYERLLDMARGGNLLDDPARTQSLIVQLGGQGPGANERLMGELQALDREALMIYQLLGIQLQLAHLVG